METNDREQRMSVASTEIFQTIQRHDLTPTESVEVLTGLCAMMVQDTRFEMDKQMRSFLSTLHNGE